MSGNASTGRCYDGEITAKIKIRLLTSESVSTMIEIPIRKGCEKEEYVLLRRQRGSFGGCETVRECGNGR